MMKTDDQRVAFTVTCSSWCMSEMMSDAGCAMTLDYHEFYEHYNQHHSSLPLMVRKKQKMKNEPKLVVVRERVLADEDEI